MEIELINFQINRPRKKYCKLRHNNSKAAVSPAGPAPMMRAVFMGFNIENFHNIAVLNIVMIFSE
jgi:hypothetical protein